MGGAGPGVMIMTPPGCDLDLWSPETLVITVPGVSLVTDTGTGVFTLAN